MLECWTVADLCRAQTRKWSWLSLRTRPGWVRPKTSISSSRGLRSGGAVTDWVDGMKPPGWDGSGVSNVGRGTQEGQVAVAPGPRRGARSDLLDGAGTRRYAIDTSSPATPREAPARRTSFADVTHQRPRPGAETGHLVTFSAPPACTHVRTSFEKGVPMGFNVTSSTGQPLSEEALRRLIEVADGCRGQSQVWIVFKTAFPYQADSVHSTEPPASAAAQAGAGLDYFGPLVPGGAAPANFYGVRKVTGTTFYPLDGPVATVLLLDNTGTQVARLTVTPPGKLPDVQNDIEALMFTPSSIDKYAIPYLSKVLGVAFAAEQRAQWLGNGPATGAAGSSR